MTVPADPNAPQPAPAATRTRSTEMTADKSKEPVGSHTHTSSSGEKGLEGETDKDRMTRRFATIKMPILGSAREAVDNRLDEEGMGGKHLEGTSTAAHDGESELEGRAGQTKRGLPRGGQEPEADITGMSVWKGKEPAKRRYEDDTNEEGTAWAKKARVEMGTGSARMDMGTGLASKLRQGQGFTLAGMALMDNGEYAMVYEKVQPTLSTQPAPPQWNSDQVDLDLTVEDDSDEDEAQGAQKAVRTQTKEQHGGPRPRPAATAKKTTSTSNAKQVQTVMLPTIRPVASKALAGKGEVKKPSNTISPLALESRLVREAIGVWQLQQACIDLYPSDKESEEWATTALAAAATTLTSEGGEEMKANLQKLLERRETRILREIRNHEADLFSTVVQTAATEVPICLHGVFDGGREAIAWRIRTLLKDFNFIYDGYDWKTDERTMKRAAFLSPCVVAVMSSVWKEAIENTGAEMFEHMPLCMMAVGTLGIWAYLKYWWTGEMKPVEQVFKMGEIPLTYDHLILNLEGFEKKKPEVFAEIQRKLLQRVKVYGAIQDTQGDMFLEPEEDE
ncbi:hypothetical protein CALCODRAFT_507809 [Calocera cornea HHB12733]|uniref:DUF6532 domain-containing protein n=1 Tax=Calocera cornea HHB12733 TaxID=1353952 RepID=A0A165H888_9BASI|nr:hypothetical protein CALCODRAFT_507809 [Calocera cornea HHB12733]